MMYKILLIITPILLIACQFNQKDNYDPAKPWPIMNTGDSWLEIFDQRGLQNATINHDRIYCNTCCLDDSTYLYALNLQTGEVDWRVTVADYACAPVTFYEDKIFYVSFTGHIYAIDKNGEIIWKNKLEGNFSNYCTDSITGNLYVSTVQNGVFEFDNDSGKVESHIGEWQLGVCLPAYDSSKYYFTNIPSDNWISVLNKENDSVFLAFPTEERLHELYLIDSLLIGSPMGWNSIWCYSANNGNLKWRIKSEYIYDQTYMGIKILNDKIMVNKSEPVFINPVDATITNANLIPTVRTYRIENKNGVYSVKIYHNYIGREEYTISVTITTANSP